MKQYLSLLLLLFPSYFLFSQAPYELGYIITNSGDTIKGKIKDRKYTAGEANPDKIKFINEKGIESKITPDKAKEYCKGGALIFRALPIGREGGLQFAEIVEYGDVILFSYISNSFVSATISGLAPKNSKDKESSKKKIDAQYFYQKKKDANSLMKVNKDKFESVSLFYFKDDAELIKKIEGKSFKFEDIRLVVKTYNEFAAKK